MHGGDIYSHKIKLDFSINVNPLELPFRAKIAYFRAFKKISNYPDQECRALTAALSKTLGIPAERLVFGNGASELIQAVLGAEKACRVLLFAPCFTGYRKAIEACGARPLYFHLNEDDDFELSERDFDRLSQVILQEKADFLILTNPNNPNGKLFNVKIVEKIIQLCNNSKVKVLIDQCFIELCDYEQTLQSQSLSAGIYILRAFTKTYAIPGLRLGYCICPDESSAITLKTQLPEWNVSSVAQEVGLALLKSLNFLKRARAVIRREREYLSSKLKALGFKLYDSEANFLLFKDESGSGSLPSQAEGDADGGEQNSHVPLDAPLPASLYQKLLKQKILIRECSDYEGLGKGWYRIAVKKHSQNRRLIKAIKKVRGK